MILDLQFQVDYLNGSLLAELNFLYFSSLSLEMI